MTEELIIELMFHTIKTAGLLSAPPITAIVVVGLLSNILQTITQIRDQALSFVPKVIAVGVIVVLAVPWYIQTIQQFAMTIFEIMGKTTL